MFDINRTKKLSEAFTKLHSLNIKHKAVVLESKVFVVDRKQNTEKRLNIEEDIRKLLIEIDKLWKGDY